MTGIVRQLSRQAGRRINQCFVEDLHWSVDLTAPCGQYSLKRRTDFHEVRELFPQPVHVKWSYRLLHGNALLKLTKPVQNDLDLRGDGRSRLSRLSRDQTKKFAVRSDIGISRKPCRAHIDELPLRCWH